MWTKFGEIVENSADVARERSVPIILITHFLNSPAAELAEVTLVCGYNENPIHAGSVSAKMGRTAVASDIGLSLPPCHRINRCHFKPSRNRRLEIYMDYNSFLETASETATRLARVSWGLLEQKAWKRQSMSSSCPILALTQ